MSRDYLSDFDAYLDKHTPAGDYVAGVLAAQIVTDLRRDDAGLLKGWLAGHAEYFVKRTILDRDLRDRGNHARRAPGEAFAEAAERFESGEHEAMSTFKVVFVIDDDDTRRHLGDMTKADHLFVAAKHSERSQSALLEAEFHKALAKRIPAGKKTSDVMDEAEYLRLRSSIRRPEKTAA